MALRVSKAMTNDSTSPIHLFILMAIMVLSLFLKQA